MILFKFASRSRPEKFFQAVENIYINAREPFQILASLDTDDPTMNNPEVIERMKRYDKLYPIFGQSKNKIDAINRDMDKAGRWEILVNMSDDMVFKEEGFDEIIRESFDNLDQCLHFPDGNHKVLITMSIMGIDYYNRFGYIYHPDYTSLWSDNEQTIVAMMLGRYKYVDKQIFEHRHPAFGKAPTDEQYKHTESYYHIDEDVFRKRLKMNFELNQDYKVPQFYPNSNTPVA